MGKCTVVKDAGLARILAACTASLIVCAPVWGQEGGNPETPASSTTGNTAEGSSAQAVGSEDPMLDFLGEESLEAPAGQVSRAQPAEPSSAAAGAALPTAEQSAPVDSAESAEAPETADTIPVASSRKPEPAAAPLKEREVRAQIEEIIVTATKREQSIREIPQSITAISGESLEKQGKLNLNDYIQEVPGVTAAQGPQGYTRVTMRGISTDTAPAAPTPQPVGMFIGDTAFTDPYIANVVPDLSAFDLSGIQVLKGPQGTLFGGAALSGAVRFELQEPVQGEWQMRGFTQLIQPRDGSLAFTGGAVINVPILKDENLALRAGFVRRNYSGTFDDARTGEKDLDRGGGSQNRAQLLWQPEDWKLKLTHISQDSNTPNARNTTPNAEGPRENTSTIEVPAVSDFSMSSIEVAHDFETMRLTSLTSHVGKNSFLIIDATPLLLGNLPAGYPAALSFVTPVVENSDAYSQEIRLQSTGADPFKWLVGGYYYDYKLYFDLEINLPLTESLLGDGSLIADLANTLGVPTSLITDNTIIFNGTSNAKSKERALFFDLSYTLWDRLELSAGARLYQTQVAGGFKSNGILLRAQNNGMNADTSNEIKERGINPKLTALFHFTDDVSAYAQVSKGYRFGGIQYVPSTPANGVPPVFKSDTLWNYELGLRTSWLDRTLNADITTFYNVYKDPIITQATPGIPINFQDNVSGAVSRGIEASLLWYTPLDGLSLSLSGAVTDAHITTPFTAVNGETIQPGQEMPGTAPTQFTAAFQYLRPAGTVNWGVNAGYTYIGQGYSDITHNTEINGYGTLNAGLLLSSNTLPLNPQVALNVSNILDVTKPIAGGTITPVHQIGTYSAYYLNAPRTFSLRLSFEF